MTVKQIHELVNNATSEALGKIAILEEDLRNVVDVGTEVFNSNAVDNYVKSLVNHIGKVVFVNRKYTGNTPSILMDGWEFGSVLQKISADLPEATENEDWELENNTSYDPNVFYKPSVSAKFFNSKVTFEIPLSFTEKQVKESFSSPEQLNGFLSMLYNEIDKAMTVKIDALIMRTINNAIGETVYSETTGGAITSRSGNKAINLLYLYNQRYGTSLTAANAITTPEFLKFAVYTIGVYKDRMSRISTLFNVGGKARFTPEEMLHTVILSDFAKAIGPFSQAPAYNAQYLTLPVKAETVPYWQASGTGYGFSSISEVKVKTASNHSVDVTGVLAVMFDRDALGVCNQDRRVTTNYNPKAEFYSNWAKFDAGYFNDLNENFILFYVA